jgi:hypothetical protein
MRMETGGHHDRRMLVEHRMAAGFAQPAAAFAKGEVMATATMNPRSGARPPDVPSSFNRTMLPLILMLVIGSGLVAAAVYFIVEFLRHRGTENEYIFRRLEEPFNLFGHDINPLWRLGFLLPLLAVAFLYAGWMYFRDGRSVGWAWASFLAMLRCAVYIIIALAFLLPAAQAWTESKQESRVLVIWDVSESITRLKDDPAVGNEKVPTRQDKVIAFLTDAKIDFMGKLRRQNLVAGYRFGRMLDESYEVFDREDASNKHWTAGEYEDLIHDLDKTGVHEPKVAEWSRDNWEDWLKPAMEAKLDGNLTEQERKNRLDVVDRHKELFGATNLGDPLVNVLNREERNLPQGIIVFTDGRSTEGGPGALKELKERCRKSMIPIFVVALGEDRPKVRIDISDLRLPKQARPEDEFRAEVIVTGEGMAGESVDVILEVVRPALPGRPESEREKVELEPVKVQFGPGQPPHGKAEFTIKPSLFKPIAAEKPGDSGKPEYEVGDWKFVAKVLKDKREVFDKPEHRSDEAVVHIVKRPLRVLLFASAPTREYHFVRTLFVRETDKKRAELSIHIQPPPDRSEVRDGVVNDVPKERLLKVFPNTFTDENEGGPETNKYLNLGMYDLIIAFDPDWTRLSQDQLSMIKKWVDLGRGLIVVGGPINTLQLAPFGAADDKPRNEQLKAIFELLPVIVEDSRTQEFERPTDEPWPLNLVGVTPDMEFMRLEEGEAKPGEKADPNPLKPWEKFFYDEDGNAGKKGAAVRGIYNFYPVKRAKDIAQVIATFGDTRAKAQDGKEMPYLVFMPYGAGKVFWIGSGELWRLRQYKESYHERFWAKLGRFVGSGSLTQLNRRINTIHGRTFRINSFVPIDAQILGKDMRPLNEKSKVELTLTLPDRKTTEKYIMTKKAAVAEGDWNGTFTTRFFVKSQGDYEYTINVIAPETNDSDSGKFIVKESNPELDNSRPDFETMYELASDAEEYLQRVKSPEVRKEILSRLRRPRLALSDKDAKSDVAAVPDDQPRFYFDLQNADLIPKCVSYKYQETKSRGKSEDLWDGGFPVGGDRKDRWFSWTLAVIVGLLSLEWLSRKLLRLA